jgi:hypothetical protein
MRITIMILMAVALCAGSASADEDRKIRDRCETKWDADYSMQVYCINQQILAARELTEDYSDIPDEIRGRCAMKWSDQFGYDWPMVLHCVKHQFESYEALR